MRSFDRIQSSSPPGAWKIKWAASAEQAIRFDSQSCSERDTEDLQDEDEYPSGVSLIGAFPRFADISFTPVVTANPRLFDNREDESAWSVTTKPHRKTVLSRLRRGEPARDPRDNILPFFSYRFGRAFDGQIGTPTWSEEEWATDATYTNVIG